MENNTPFKILLILTIIHISFIDALHPNINTTPLIQLMDQRVTATWKAYYLRRIFSQATAETVENTEKALMQFWKDCTIQNCIRNLAWAWGNVTKNDVNVISKKILRRSIRDSKGFAKDEEVAKINKVVVDTGSNFHLAVDEDDAEELLLVAPEELTNKELLDLEQECIGEEEAREKETAEEKEKTPQKSTVKGLEEAYANLNKLLKMFENMDANTKRFSVIERNVHGALTAHEEVYDKKETN